MQLHHLLPLALALLPSLARADCEPACQPDEYCGWGCEYSCTGEGSATEDGCFPQCILPYIEGSHCAYYRLGNETECGACWNECSNHNVDYCKPSTTTAVPTATATATGAPQAKRGGGLRDLFS